MDLRGWPFSDIYRHFPVSGTTESQLEYAAVQRKTTRGISMRKLIYTINITLDGCCDHTKTVADEEVLDYYTRLVRDADLWA
jgi:hypothetical protein